MFREKFDRDFTAEELHKIKRIPSLTPGDFKVVHQKNFFSENQSVEELISQLELEASYKKQRSIGI